MVRGVGVGVGVGVHVGCKCRCGCREGVDLHCVLYWMMHPYTLNGVCVALGLYNLISVYSGICILE